MADIPVVWVDETGAVLDVGRATLTTARQWLEQRERERNPGLRVQCRHCSREVPQVVITPSGCEHCEA